MNILLVLTLLIGSGLRLVHLIGDHYFLLGPDSYWFEYQAQLIRSGENICVLKSGLAYPVAYLPGASYWLPIGLYVIGALLIYWFIRRTWGKWPALAGVFVWTAIPEGVLISSAGWIDRDALMAILISAAGCITIIWPGRVVGIAAIISIMIIVAVLWVPLGTWIILYIVSMIYFTQMVIFRDIRRNAYIPIFIGAALIITLAFTAIDSTTDSIIKYTGYHTGIAETDGLGLSSLVICYGFFLPIIFIALIRAARSRELTALHPTKTAGINDNCILWAPRYKDPIQLQLAVWIVAVLVAAIFAQRMMLFAVFPASALAGMLIYQAFCAVRTQSIAEINKKRLTAILAAGCGVLLLASGIQAYKTGDIRGIAPDADWQDALGWLQDCEHCTVASHWNYEKWIMALTHQDTISCKRYYCPELESDYVIAPASADIDLPVAYSNDGVIVYRNKKKGE